MKKSYPDIVALILRLGFGGAMLVHGVQKAEKLLGGFDKIKFADPIGIGEPATLVLAIFTELICAIALVLGYYTRIAAALLGVTMIVAMFIVHGGDSWAKKELAALYLIGYLASFLMGGGKYSVTK